MPAHVIMAPYRVGESAVDEGREKFMAVVGSPKAAKQASMGFELAEAFKDKRQALMAMGYSGPVVYQVGLTPMAMLNASYSPGCAHAVRDQSGELIVEGVEIRQVGDANLIRMVEPSHEQVERLRTDKRS